MSSDYIQLPAFLRPPEVKPQEISQQYLEEKLREKPHYIFAPCIGLKLPKYQRNLSRYYYPPGRISLLTPHSFPIKNKDGDVMDGKSAGEHRTFEKSPWAQARELAQAYGNWGVISPQSIRGEEPAKVALYHMVLLPVEIIEAQEIKSPGDPAGIIPYKWLIEFLENDSRQRLVNVRADFTNREYLQMETLLEELIAATRVCEPEFMDMVSKSISEVRTFVNNGKGGKRQFDALDARVFRAMEKDIPFELFDIGTKKHQEQSQQIIVQAQMDQAYMSRIASLEEKLAKITTNAPAEETKVCPECAEHVKAAAAKCRYCGYRFESKADAEVAQTVKDDPAGKIVPPEISIKSIEAVEDKPQATPGKRGQAVKAPAAKAPATLAPEVDEDEED